MVLAFSVYYTIQNFNLNFKIISFLIINCVFLLIFYVIIRIYEEKDIENKIIISKLLKINEQELNNEKIYKLFKRTYVQKNILDKDYKILKENFEKFIPKNFIKNISKWINEQIDLWIAIEQNLHIMFIDISGFTNISEHLTAQKALFLLNIYFDWIVEISKDNWWYVDKFLGDGIMLLFDSKNSDNVIKAAIEIRKLVNRINLANFKYKINVWIWINSWKVTLWTIWAKNRMDITAIWDPVNVAARLEHQTRIEQDWIIFSKETYDLIENKDKFNINKIGKKFIKGKKEKIELYSILEKKKN